MMILCRWRPLCLPTFPEILLVSGTGDSAGTPFLAMGLLCKKSHDALTYVLLLRKCCIVRASHGNMFCENDFVHSNCNISFQICCSPVEVDNLGASSIYLDFLIPVEYFELLSCPLPERMSKTFILLY